MAEKEKIINIEDLNRVAVEYNNVLAQLPFDEFEATLRDLGITLFQQLKGELIDVIYERKGNISRPYKLGGVDDAPGDAAEIGKAYERKLKCEDCILLVQDNIKNMQSKKIQSNLIEVSDPISKTHPVESLILSTMVKTVGEDNLSAIFPGVRDTENGTEPVDMVDGFHKKIDIALNDGEITVANGNLYESGAITEENALEKFIAFVKDASKHLKKVGYVLMDPNSKLKILRALTTLYQDAQLVTEEQFMSYLKMHAGCPNLVIKTSDIVGSGDQWIYTVADNLQVAVNTLASTQFVEVTRVNPKDRNWLGFNMEWSIGTRILHFHAKKFRINDQVNTGGSATGDYIS